MPDQARETTEQQTEELIKAAKGKLILVVLDDLCEFVGGVLVANCAQLSLVIVFLSFVILSHRGQDT